MPQFEIIGHGKNTGRKRKRIYTAPDMEQACQLAENDATIPETITELSSPPPTDAQIEYAFALGIQISNDDTKESLSDRIDQAIKQGQQPTRNDKLAGERGRRFAEIYHVPCSIYVGKKELFNSIFDHLAQPGREDELASWFTFRVYRSLVEGAVGTPIEFPDHQIICRIGKTIAQNKSLLGEIRRYHPGEKLIWFGSFETDHGKTVYGASKNTRVFRHAAMLLAEQVSDIPSTVIPPDKPIWLTVTYATLVVGGLVLIYLYWELFLGLIIVLGIIFVKFGKQIFRK